MLFTRSLIAALLSVVAYAQSDANPFKNNGVRTATAGQPLTLEWNPTTDGTVSLILRSGPSSDLNPGTPIATGLENTGSYTWNVPDSIVRGSDYTVEIVSDSDSSENNFTPPFSVDSSNTTPASTSAASSGASSAMSTTAPSVSPTSSDASATNTESSASATGSSESSTMTTGTSSRATTSSAPTGDAVSTGAASQTGAAARATAAAGFLGVVALGALAL